MTARLHDASTTATADPIKDLAVVRLLRDTDVDAQGRLPAGSLGAVVFVYDEGEAYEVEFAEPFAAVVALRRSEIEPTETGLDRVTDAFGPLHRRR